MADEEKRLTDDGDSFAILIGSPMKFIGSGLLSRLVEQGWTPEQIAEWLNPGETVMTEKQLADRHIVASAKRIRSS